MHFDFSQTFQSKKKKSMEFTIFKYSVLTWLLKTTSFLIFLVCDQDFFPTLSETKANSLILEIEI